MSRPLFIGANWKMHSVPFGALRSDSPYCSNEVETVVFPSLLDVHDCLAAGLIIGAQHARHESHGAFTGEVSMQQVKEAGCTHVLCGHSERRTLHGETDKAVGLQVEAAFEAGLIPVLCIGETLKEREAGRTNQILAAQLSCIEWQKGIVIAYEPVWAIGTGQTATAEQAEAAHKFIRSQLPETLRAVTRIIYGGSMKPDNALELLAQPNIDGGLVGGASLHSDEFAEIIAAAHQIEG